MRGLLVLDFARPRRRRRGGAGRPSLRSRQGSSRCARRDPAGERPRTPNLLAYDEHTYNHHVAHARTGTGGTLLTFTVATCSSLCHGTRSVSSEAVSLSYLSEHLLTCLCVHPLGHLAAPGLHWQGNAAVPRHAVATGGTPAAIARRYSMQPRRRTQRGVTLCAHIVKGEATCRLRRQQRQNERTTVRIRQPDALTAPLSHRPAAPTTPTASSSRRQGAGAEFDVVVARRARDR